MVQFAQRPKALRAMLGRVRAGISAGTPTCGALVMRRFACAFISVVTALLAGLGYMAVFHDQLSPDHGVNAGQGMLAPAWRHMVEVQIIIFTTLASVGFGFYLLFGTPYEIAVMRSATQRLAMVHVVGGMLTVAGYLLSRMAGSAGVRDLIVGLVGTWVLAMGIWGHRPRSAVGPVRDDE